MGLGAGRNWHGASGNGVRRQRQIGLTDQPIYGRTGLPNHRLPFPSNPAPPCLRENQSLNSASLANLACSAGQLVAGLWRHVRSPIEHLPTFACRFLGRPRLFASRRLFFLQKLVVTHEPAGLVAAFARDFIPHFADFIDDRVGFHEVWSISSSGVTSSGVKRRKRSLIRRICTCLLALARWTQFQVSRKSIL